MFKPVLSIQYKVLGPVLNQFLVLVPHPPALPANLDDSYKNPTAQWPVYVKLSKRPHPHYSYKQRLEKLVQIIEVIKEITFPMILLLQSIIIHEF